MNRRWQVIIRTVDWLRRLPTHAWDTGDEILCHLCYDWFHIVGRAIGIETSVAQHPSCRDWGEVDGLQVLRNKFISKDSCSGEAVVSVFHLTLLHGDFRL